MQRARAKRAQEYDELNPYISSSAVALGARSGAAAAAASPVSKDTLASATAPEQQPSSAPENNQTRTPASCKGVKTSRARRGHMDVEATGPHRIAEAQRAFRRLEPDKMFRAARTEGEPIWAYWGKGEGQSQPPVPPGKRASTTEGFVLVPVKQLTELRALEAALRRERNLLKTHCLLALNEGEVRVYSAHKEFKFVGVPVDSVHCCKGEYVLSIEARGTSESHPRVR